MLVLREGSEAGWDMVCAWLLLLLIEDVMFVL